MTAPHYTLHPVAAILFQAEIADHSGIYLACAIVAALALLVQALVYVGIAIGGLKAQKEIKTYLQELHGKAMPLLHQSHALVAELTPQIKHVAARVESVAASVDAITAVVTAKVEELGPTVSAANRTVLEASETVREANRKTAAQVERINGMVTTALDATAQLGATIHQGIRVPVREVAGVVTGVKAAIDTFFSGARAFGSGAGVRRTNYTVPAAAPRTLPAGRFTIDPNDKGL